MGSRIGEQTLGVSLHATRGVELAGAGRGAQGSATPTSLMYTTSGDCRITSATASMLSRNVIAGVTPVIVLTFV